MNTKTIVPYRRHFRALSYATGLSLVVAALMLLASDRSTAPASAADDGWISLFDGKTLNGWKLTKFGGDGDVHVDDGDLIMEMGVPLTGITWTKDFPKKDFEISLDAKRVEGGDFFVGLTFPVRDSHASLIVGGWAGSVVGISCIDGHDASDNETTQVIKFDNNKWYKFRVQVREDRIRCWIDDKQIIDQDIKGKKIHTRSEVDPSRPMGLATYETKAAIKNFKYKLVK